MLIILPRRIPIILLGRARLTFSNHLRMPSLGGNIAPILKLVSRVLFCFCFILSKNQNEANDAGVLYGVI